MTKIINICIFLLICLIYGCEERKYANVIIEINPFEIEEEINLSEIVDSIKYIKLQTDSNCVMGRIHDIVISEKYIYALDISQQIIFVFDKKGKFISKLDKRGKGPDEYLNLGPMFVDKNEKYIEFISFSGKNSKIFKYSNISFNLLDNKRPMPRISANSCREEDELYYFSTQQIENVVNGKPTNASILIVKNGNIEKVLFDKDIITQHSSFSPNVECFTKNENNQLFVSLMYDNTFYQLKNMDAYPTFSVDFGKYGIDNSIGFKPIKEQQRYLESANGASFPVLNINNSNIMAFSYYFKNNMKKTDLHQYIRLKNRNKTFHTKRIKNNITSFPNEVYLSTYFCGISHEVWYKNFLVDIVLPSNYFSNGETKTTVEGLGDITIEDNPIIVMMKLKEELK
ncbi:MAG: 6-bladed beta-propeller [Bacteroidota bacterium]|nr:hypothetical protein [Odoribacter sp.]MDP3642549.1 6-bladed beta-propeller [Bacteroidota bacterium]